MTPSIVDLLPIVLTILVLSRVVGDNPLFRVAQYLFVGASLGLAFVVAYHQVLRPSVVSLAEGRAGAAALYWPPIVLGVLLVSRITRRQYASWLANIPLALIFGVGSALALGGAIVGTLLPQILDTARPLGGSPAQMVGGVTLALGTLITLSSFHYTAAPGGRASRIIALSAVVGHWLLMVAFGFFFASALQTYLSALTERLSFILDFLNGLL